MNPVYIVCLFIFSLFLCSCESKDLEGQGRFISFLHIGDHRSHLEPHNDFKFEFDDFVINAEAGGFPRVIKKIKELRSLNSRSFSIHTGDAITGDIYYNLFRGQADAVMMNEVCFDALLVGNHEVDLSESGLIKFLEFLKNRECNTPVLSANIIPKVGVSKLARNHRDEFFRPYVVKRADNQRIAFIGISNLRKSINSGLVNTAYGFLDETQTAQGYINLLKKRGITRFVIISDQSYAQDIALAKQLTDVDVIIGGDSRMLLGEFSRYGLNNDEPYPTTAKNKDGDDVCIVESWRETLGVGELRVLFDDEGVVAECAGQMHLLLANKPLKLFDKKANKLHEPKQQKQVLSVLESDPQISFIAENIESRNKLDSFSASAFRNRKIGTATENLCFEWVPGSGESKLCDKQETGKRGSDITNLVAQTFLAFIPEADIAIQNAGGIRSDIKQGDITVGDVYRLLPYVNKLTLVKMSGQQIKSVLEGAVEFSLSELGGTGAYPYAANLRWQLYASNPRGSRINQLEHKNKHTGEWEPLNKEKIFTVATNDFISKGNDGYKIMSKVEYEKRTKTHIDYSEIFIEYLKTKQQIQKPKPSDYSTQAYYLERPEKDKEDNLSR